MDDSSNRSKLQFTIRTLLFLALCVAGLLAGYRIGHQRGYTIGVQRRLSEVPVTVVYDVADHVSYMVKDEESGGWRPAHTDERTPTIADFDSLIEVITSTIHPDSWEEIGGAGSIQEVDDKLSLVVRQYPYVHEEIQSLFRSLPSNVTEGEERNAESDVRNKDG